MDKGTFQRFRALIPVIRDIRGYSTTKLAFPASRRICVEQAGGIDFDDEGMDPSGSSARISNCLLATEHETAAKLRMYVLLADLILLLHFGFIAFVVGGFVIIWIGYFCGWKFVRNFWFRIAHLIAMGYVALEALVGLTCPLTTWEERLRAMSGQAEIYHGSFIQHWVHRLMFFDLPEWIFTVVYIAFFAFLLLTFWIVKPEPRKTPHTNSLERA